MASTFSMVEVADDAMGEIPKILDRNLLKIFPQSNNIIAISHGIQKAAILGRLKVCKIKGFK